MPVFLKALSVLSASTDSPLSPLLILCDLSTDLTGLLKLHSQKSPINSWKSNPMAFPQFTSLWFLCSIRHHKHLKIPFSVGFMALNDPLPCNTCLAFKFLFPLFSSLWFNSMPLATRVILKQYAEDPKFFLPPLLTSFLGFSLTFLSTFPCSPNVQPILQIQYG